MAYGISASSGRIGYGVNHYTVDEFDDMKKLPTSAAAGSTAFVVKTSQKFMLNNKRQWVEIVGSSGSGQQENIIWDGGTPEGNQGSGCGCGCNQGSSESDSQGSEDTEHYIWDGGEVNG